MTPSDQAHHELLADAAAYVLGALEPDEEMRLEDHLLGCAECRHELAAMRQAVDALAMCAPQYRAPSSLRTQVLRSIDSDSRPSGNRQRGRWIAMLAAKPRYSAALAALIAAVAALGMALLPGGSSGTRVLQARVQNSPGRAGLEVGHGRAALVVRNFPPPAPGHTYEVWLQRQSGPPAPTRTLFSVTATGSADIGLPESLKRVRAILVTQEPAGGSVVSTHAPVIVAPVSGID